MIEFRLACIDPNGNPTTGIRRVQGNQGNYNVITGLGGTVDDAATSIKANAAAWNRDRYLNIWSASMNGSVLGYATFPGAAANVDGIVIQFNAFGRTGNLQSNYDKGRTATHEVGHWLSLIHIWGNDLGACNGTDNVADTPNQGNSYASQCPSGQRFSCGSSDMYQNYMDYTNDACMNLFTNGQSDRMKALFLPGNARDGFVSWSDISGSATLCGNNNYTYSVTSSGSSFNWSVSSNLSIVSGQGTSQITVTRISDGPATVSVRNQEVCSSKTVWVGTPDVTQMRLNGVPIQPFSSNNVCFFNLFNLSAITSGGGTSSWQLLNTTTNAYIASSTYNGATISAGGASGTFAIKYTMTNSCGSRERIYPFNVLNCMSNYTVYPNPVRDYLTIEFNNTDNLTALPETISLLSEASTIPVRVAKIKDLFDQKTFKDGTKVVFDVRDLPRGIYYLHIADSRKEGQQVESIRILLD